MVSQKCRCRVAESAHNWEAKKFWFLRHDNDMQHIESTSSNTTATWHFCDTNVKPIGRSQCKISLSFCLFCLQIYFWLMNFHYRSISILSSQNYYYICCIRLAHPSDLQKKVTFWTGLSLKKPKCMLRECILKIIDFKFKKIDYKIPGINFEMSRIDFKCREWI